MSIERSISNRLTAAGLAVALGASGCGSGKKPTRPSPPQVVVSVTASDPHGLPLHFRWRATDGSVVDIDAPSTTWTLPAGPGLHFAYVLVSNGQGGYAERRVAVSTDSIGVASEAAPPRTLVAPAAPAPLGVPVRVTMRASGGYPSVPLGDPEQRDGFYLPGGSAFLQPQGGGPATATAAADARGLLIFQGVPPGLYDLHCRHDPLLPFEPCLVGLEVQQQAINEAIGAYGTGADDHQGRLVLGDGSPCGTVNEFFGVEALPTATLLGGAGQVLRGPFKVNPWGQWSIGTAAGATSVRLACEGAPPVVIPAPQGTDRPLTIIAGSSAPSVTAMSARLAGAEVGIFLPPPTGAPSDLVADPEFFLSAKGIDDRRSACSYYRAVGAVSACDAAGKSSGAISFDDWKRATGLAPFQRAGADEVDATYINRVDLGLTRNHHSITYGPGQASAYVCNHLGPSGAGQAAADAAIQAARAGRNLVACVGMDHGVTPGVNGGQPFTRFLIFGPSGELLPSVNLDGRREKFVPGVCVACHGGDRYAGRYPTEGARPADIGAHFLPYDTGNFTFSSVGGLRKADQETAIHRLNLNALQGSVTPATVELVQGWYASGGDLLDEDYLPASWAAATPAGKAFYRQVYARSCRTCHVAFAESLNFDHAANLLVRSQPSDEEGSLRTELSACIGTSRAWFRNFSMPNSLTTMNLYWGSAGTAADQPALMAAFLQELGAVAMAPGQGCALYLEPAP